MIQPEVVRAPRSGGVLLIASPSIGCAVHSAHDRRTVSTEVLDRTRQALRSEPGTGPDLPDGVSLGDGLSEDEAVAIALSRNPDIEVTLAEMGSLTLYAGRTESPIITKLPSSRLDLPGSLPGTKRSESSMLRVLSAIRSADAASG